MPNDILKLSDKRILVAGPITSYSYEIGYAFTTQGASVSFFTPQADKGQRISDTLNDAREIHRHYGRASACPFDASNLDKSISAAIQSINGIDVYIDAMNIFSPKDIASTVQTQIYEKISSVFQERQRGRMINLVDNYLLEQNNEVYKNFRQNSIDWIQGNKMSLLQRNIVSHILRINLSEDCLLFLNPQFTLNESLKKINGESGNLKITKPDSISKTLLAAAGDLLSSVVPMDLNII